MISTRPHDRKVRIGLTPIVLALLVASVSLPASSDEVPGSSDITSSAEAIPAQPAAAAKAKKGPVLPPFQAGDTGRKSDWVQIKSGEWARGDITRVHDGDLYFDSKEFDDVKIGWGDVVTLIPAGEVTCRFKGRRIYTGTLEMRNGTMRIVTPTGVVEEPQDQLVSLLVGVPKELNYWSAGASLGFTGRKGNTDQSDLTIRADVMRQTVLTRATVSYLGEISTSRGDTTANSHRVPANLDFSITDRLYITAPALEYFTDEISNIANRFTAGVGVGYELMDLSWLLWDIYGGGAYQYIGYEEVFAGPLTTNEAAVVLGTDIDFDLPKGIEWDNSYKVQVVATDIDATNHHAVSELSFDIWGPLEIDLSFIFDRIEKPRQRSDGSRPESNDYRFVVGLGFDI
jgi:hypothetical protein